MQNKIIIMEFEVRYPNLSSQLDEKEFEFMKLLIWSELLNKGDYPVKWYKRNKNGTRVKCKTIKNSEQYEECKNALKAQIALINLEYGSNLKMEIETEEY